MKQFLNKIKSNKNLLILTIAILCLLLLVFRVSYSYLSENFDSPRVTSDEISSGTVDRLIFSKKSLTNLTGLDFFDFNSNKESVFNGAATLIANNETNNASDTYYAYLDIKNNTFKYSIDNTKPELLLTITGPNGAITSLPDLTYKTAGGVSGFDITTYTGLIKLTGDAGQTISTTSSTDGTKHYWEARITLIKYSESQVGNVGATIDADFLLQKDKIVTSVFAEYLVTNVPKVTSGEGLYHHTEGLTNGAGDNNYRYAGADPNNYVKFNNEEYRIIGVFDGKVKLIKSESIGNMAWDDSSNNWASPADLNTYLNTTWYDGLEEDKNKIAEVTWYLGGPSGVNNFKAKNAYHYERDSKKVYSGNAVTCLGKIGLMYVSDYGYAAERKYWETTLYEYDGGAQNSDWLCDTPNNQWTITHNSSSNNKMYIVYSNDGGYVGRSLVNNDIFVVKPAFYLKSSVEYVSGDGSKSNPYFIKGGS